MSLPKGFEIVFISDIRFEFLAVEVYFHGYRVLQLNREKGIDNIEIEFLLDLQSVPNDIDIKFLLAEFNEVLNIAKNDLITYENSSKE